MPLAVQLESDDKRELADTIGTSTRSAARLLESAGTKRWFQARCARPSMALRTRSSARQQVNPPSTERNREPGHAGLAQNRLVAHGGLERELFDAPIRGWVDLHASNETGRRLYGTCALHAAAFALSLACCVFARCCVCGAFYVACRISHIKGTAYDGSSNS